MKEAESEAEQVKQSTANAKEIMERVVSAWDVYSKSLSSLEPWLAQPTAAETQVTSVGLSQNLYIKQKSLKSGFGFTF